MEPGGRRAEGKGEAEDAAAVKIQRSYEDRAGSWLGWAARERADPPRGRVVRGAGAALRGAEES